MKLKFNGMYENKSSGCGVCGKRHGGGRRFITVKTFYLPSGGTLTFRANNVYELVDKDAEFLLKYNYRNDRGEKVSVFEVVR